MKLPWVYFCIYSCKFAHAQIGKTRGCLSSFVIDPFVPVSAENELYVAIYSERDADIIMFYHAGGVSIGDVDSKVNRLTLNRSYKHGKSTGATSHRSHTNRRDAADAERVGD